MGKKIVDSLPFEIEARIPIQLGRESISSSIVAIIELVKNSYDADATKVIIDFSGTTEKRSSLVISDNGHGMNFATLSDSWLRIGTDRKMVSSKSPRFKRILTGAKGLGRLGVDRLAKKLDLFTKTDKMSDVIELKIDWTLYESKNVVLSKILNQVFSHEIPSENTDIAKYLNSKSTVGTVLKFTALRDKWDEDYLSRLLKQLSTLVSPFKGAEEFIVEVILPDGNINVVSSSQYLDEALLKVKAKMYRSKNSNGKKGFFVDLDINKQDDKAIQKPIKKLAWSDFIDEESSDPSCGPLELELYFYTQRKSDFFDSVPSRDAARFVKNNYGVRIYRDRFRVLPYGDPSGKGDWLDLGNRAQSNPSGMAQGGWRVNVYQLIGAMHIGRTTNPNLIDQTNREGLQETSALFDLQKFAIQVVSRFELAATDHARSIKEKIDPKKAGVERKAKEASDGLSAVTSRLGRQLDSFDNKNTVDLKSIEEIRSDIKMLETAVEKVNVSSSEKEEFYKHVALELQQQKDTLSNLASLGILAIAFGHEATQDANIVAMYASDLKSELSDQYDLSKVHLSYLDKLYNKTVFLSGLSNFYLSSIEASKRKRKDISPVAVAQRVVKALYPALERRNITIDIVGDELVSEKITSFEIDFESLYVNLITNAVWAMSRTPGKKRKILVSFALVHAGNSLDISISDSGKGISKANLNSIFKPMFSTVTDARGHQIGTGMGLYICKNVVEDHMNGTIRATGKGTLGGATFDIRVPVSKRGRSKK